MDSSSSLASPKYTEWSTGPFQVFVLGKTPKHPLSIAKILTKKADQSLLKRSTFNIAGNNRIKASFASIQEANEFISHVDNIDELNVHIPFSLMFRSGIIKNVPTDITTTELTDTVASDIPIASVRRFSRKEDGKNIDLPIIEVLFVGTQLPQSVSFYGLNFKVLPNVRLPQKCVNCFR